ncbi:MAG: excinuclease ABC subunit UvrC [Firmicutes bacterium]|jgi:excinuclease ABC subunit C|nr:excinuclease ABC subunit UvrC [Bacillota bacterium]
MERRDGKGITGTGTALRAEPSAQTALREKVNSIPDMAGVYLFRDSAGRVIYVGKAVSLRDRVKSHLQRGRASAGPFGGLPDRIADVEYITTTSGVEALILEANLVRKYKPRYNIKLKDDKHFPYIRVTLDEEWPRAIVARSMRKDGSRYFGPYTRAHSVRDTLRALQRAFRFRTCSDEVMKHAKRPCLHYHIGRCLAPCRGLVDRETYLAGVRDLCSLLEGRGGDVIRGLESRMKHAAEALDFETAARLRDQIRAIEDIREKQSIVLPDMEDRDVVGLAWEGDDAFVQVFQVRDGKLLGRETFGLSDVSGAEPAEMLESFLELYYPAASSVPGEIVLPRRPTDCESLEGWLARLKGGRVRIRVPARGRLRDLVRMAETNAGLALEEARSGKGRDGETLQGALDDLAAAAGLKSRPRRIEGYDISNIQGRQPVGAMVVFTDGAPDKHQYRRFRIGSVNKPDDYAMMQEMVLRRFRRGLAEKRESAGEGGSRFSEFPDLVLVDGGRGQLNAVLEVLRHLGLQDIPALGLAKEREEVYLPDRVEPLRLPADSRALLLIRRLRDEAHRFAVGYHRKLRGKEGLKSALDDVPGVGPKRRSALLRRFGSARGVARATVEEIAAVEGIGPALAVKIKRALSE